MQNIQWKFKRIFNHALPSLLMLGASVLSMQTAQAAFAKVEPLVMLTGNVEDGIGGNGAMPGGSSTRPLGLVAGTDGYLYGMHKNGGGTTPINSDGGLGWAGLFIAITSKVVVMKCWLGIQMPGPVSVGIHC